MPLTAIHETVRGIVAQLVAGDYLGPRDEFKDVHLDYLAAARRSVV